MHLIELTNKGLYCARGDFFIDPWGKVDKALITHAHGDHARHGHKYYLSHTDSIPVMKIRLGTDAVYEGIHFNKVRNINGVKVSFHPAGHIIGSAQIRVEHEGEVWVVSGDYKTEDDGLSPAFEPVKCHTFITESTFGLPVYNWASQQDIFKDINGWWKQNAEKETASVILGYSLGKAQRILMGLDREIGPVYLHGAIYNLHEALIAAGIPLPHCPKVGPDQKKSDYRKAMIIAPPSAAGSAWLRRFTPFSTGIASGWMALRGTKRRKAADKGFVLSDHADWQGLNTAINATGAERVLVTHGYQGAFSRWLNEQGYEAYPLKTMFEGESAELNEAASEPVEENGEGEA